jgi:hypothetical protein
VRTLSRRLSENSHLGRPLVVQGARIFDFGFDSGWPVFSSVVSSFTRKSQIKSLLPKSVLCFDRLSMNGKDM